MYVCMYKDNSVLKALCLCMYTRVIWTIEVYMISQRCMHVCIMYVCAGGESLCIMDTTVTSSFSYFPRIDAQVHREERGGDRIQLPTGQQQPQPMSKESQDFRKHPAEAQRGIQEHTYIHVHLRNTCTHTYMCIHHTYNKLTDGGSRIFFGLFTEELFS